MNPVCIPVINKKCSETSSNLIYPQKEPQNIVYGMPYTEFSYDGLNVKLSLKGKYQVQNAITAIEAARVIKNKLPLSDEDIINGLKNSSWKCRFEIFDTLPTIVLDGAHNSHGIEALMESIDTYFKNKKKIFVFSMLNEKDYKKSVEMILDRADFIIATSVPSLRQTSAQEIYNEIKKHKEECIYEEDPVKALELAKEKAKKDDCAVFVFGSLYLSGMLRKYVK